MSKVSINLCVYNGENYIREALDSIVDQTYKDWELVIINDGSSDSTESIIKEYINKECPIVYHYQENHGLGYSRNEALKRSSGEFIAFIDHDDIWLPEKLEKQIPLFYNDKKIAIVVSNAIRFKQNSESSLFCKNKPKSGYVFRELLTNYFICLSSAVIRRNVLNDLDEWFDSRFLHAEESDLFLRIAHKWHLAYVDEPLVKNRIHQESSTYLRPDLSPKELEMIINKFIGLYSDFATMYKYEILTLRYYVQYSFALIDWEQGKNYLVRKRLSPFLFIKPRALVPFLFSIFPYTYYKYFLRFFNKYIRHITVA